MRVLDMGVRLRNLTVLWILLSDWESAEKLMMLWAILRLLVGDDCLDTILLVLIARGYRCGSIGDYPLEFQQLLLLIGSER